jgi:hypothetical protein
VARSALEPGSPKTWSLRLFDAIPLPPIWVGIGIGLSIFGLYLAYTWTFGPSIGGLSGTLPVANLWGAELILAFLIGFAPTATTYTLRGSLRDLEDLRPGLGCSDEEYADLRRQITSFRPGPLRLTGVLSVVLTVGWVAISPEIWLDGRRPPLTHPSFLWLAGRNALMSWSAARALHLEIVLARAFSRLGDRLSSIDLLNQSPLAPFGRRGLRTVLLWMLFAAFYSLLFTGNWAAGPVPLLIGSILLYAVIGFLLPVRGARRRIHEEKQAELHRIRTAIRETRERTLARRDETGGGRLADLVAYEGRLTSVHEWPFDASTLLRWALYVALGVGSWFGGAIVERGLDTALR